MSSSNRFNTQRHTTGVGRTSIRPRVQNTFQIYAKILSAIQVPDEVFTSVQKLVKFWLQDKYPQLRFPADSIIGNIPFPGTVPGLIFDSVNVPEIPAWAFRLEHPDNEIAGRTWKTEIGIRQSAASLLFGARVVCSSLSNDDVPIVYTCPRVVRDIIAKVGLSDALPISFTPWEISKDEELLLLQDALQDQSRSLPIIVLSEIDRNQEGCGQLGKYALDINYLARNLQGLAHIVVLPWQLSYNWTNLVSKTWSVYRGAVRTYYPKLDLEKSDPWNHPSVNIEKIVFWRHKELLAEKAFSDFLVDSIMHHSITKHSPWREAVFIDEIRTQKTKIEYDSIFHKLLSKSDVQINESVQELKAKFDEERALLEKKIEDLEIDAEKYNDDAIKSDRELNSVLEKNTILRSKVDALLFQLAEANEGQAESTKSYPESYDELENWINTEFPESISLHPRATRSINEAEYEDLPKLCQAVEMLAGPYRSMRLKSFKREDFEKLLGDNHFEISPSIDPSRAGEEGEAYYVKYMGKKEFIGFHLKHSNARDPKRCLRIYFFWDSNANLVVICWLPGHLPTRIT